MRYLFDSGKIILKDWGRILALQILLAFFVYYCTFLNRLYTNHTEVSTSKEKIFLKNLVAVSINWFSLCTDSLTDD